MMLTPIDEKVLRAFDALDTAELLELAMIADLDPEQVAHAAGYLARRGAVGIERAPLIRLDGRVLRPAVWSIAPVGRQLIEEIDGRRQGRRWHPSAGGDAA